MGGRHACHLNSKQHRHILEHITDIMETLAPLYQHHYCANLLEQLRNKHMEPAETRPLIQHPDAAPQGRILLEGSLPQYLDGTWRHRHLQVTSSFTVESRDSKEVFKGGWGCKKELLLSGCEICTSIQEHRALVENMCKHITGRSDGKMACWDCPTAFPVFIQHPYSAPVCLATTSSQEQTRWANTLRAAAQHQSSVLWCEDSPESRAFLDAVCSLRQLRGCQTAVLPMGNEEEVLVSMVMEEVMSYLKDSVFLRKVTHHSRSKQGWIRLLSEVHRMAEQQVKTKLAVLKEKLSLRCSELEEQICAGLQQASLLRDHLAHTITEDMCELMLQSLHAVIPRLDRTLQEVATPICDGFASMRQYFLETCEDIIDQGSKKASMKEVLRPLSGLGADDSRMWQRLARLKMSPAARAWLQETWGVHSGTWTPLALKAQNALYKVVDRNAGMFRRLVSCYPCCSLDHSQHSAVLCRVRDTVVKHLDTELLTVRSQLILEAILQLTLPTFTRRVGEPDLSCYDAMIKSDQAVFVHPDIIFHCILRDSMACHIQSVMRHSLPQQCVPLSASPSSLSTSSSGFSEPRLQDLLPPGACQQNSCQTSEDSVSGSETLTPSTLSACDDSLCLATVSPQHSELVTKENHTPILLDAGEYIHLSELLWREELSAQQSTQ